MDSKKFEYDSSSVDVESSTLEQLHDIAEHCRTFKTLKNIQDIADKHCRLVLKKLTPHDINQIQSEIRRNTRKTRSFQGGSCHLIPDSIAKRPMPKTGPKNFQCRHCSSMFAYKSLLKIHVGRVHLKSQPFQCKYCQKSFNQKGGTT